MTEKKLMLVNLVDGSLLMYLLDRFLISSFAIQKLKSIFCDELTRFQAVAA